eukprot:IDg23862t1
MIAELDVNEDSKCISVLLLHTVIKTASIAMPLHCRLHSVVALVPIVILEGRLQRGRIVLEESMHHKSFMNRMASTIWEARPSTPERPLRIFRDGAPIFLPL